MTEPCGAPPRPRPHSTFHTWRRLKIHGALTATQAAEAVVPASARKALAVWSQALMAQFSPTAGGMR